MRRNESYAGVNSSPQRYCSCCHPIQHHAFFTSCCLSAPVDVSVGRDIDAIEHIRLVLFALGNSVCEESISRGFFYHKLFEEGGLSPELANLSQAAAFSMWHYHWTPSSLVGLGLTFVHGWIMGILRLIGGGLFLPILAHAIADYFIFAVIARGILVGNSQICDVVWEQTSHDATKHKYPVIFQQ